MPRTKQPASACSKVNTARDRKVTSAVFLGSSLFIPVLALSDCQLCFRNGWHVWWADGRSGKSASLPNQTLWLLSLQMVSNALPRLFTWMWELPHRTNMKSPELVSELRVFFDHQPKTFQNNNSPFLSAALKASRDGTMPTTWCQRPWWRPTAQCGTRLSRSRASRWSRCSPASSWCGRSRRSSTLPQGTRAPCLDSWRVYFKTMQYPHCLSISKQIEIHNTPVIIPHRVYDHIFSWLFFFLSLPTMRCSFSRPLLLQPWNHKYGVFGSLLMGSCCAQLSRGGKCLSGSS